VIPEERAAEALGILVGGTQGWNNEAVAIYLTQLVQLDDVDALRATCLHLVQTHNDPGRPSLARILDRYRYEATQNQRRNPRPQIPQHAGGRQLNVIPVKDGLRVAWDAYVAECGRQGREPNRVMFAGWARRIGDNYV